MPFPRRLLNDYETISADLHPHWWFLGPPSIATLGVIVFWGVLSGKVDGAAEQALNFLVVAALLVVVSWLIVRSIQWRTTYFVVTSHRVIFRQGVLSRNGVEIPLERVNNVNFHQNLFERIVGAGDLLIESGGADGQQTFTDIQHPESVQNLIHAAIQARTVHDGVTSAPADIASQLEKLEGMLMRGTLTREEFEEQKRRIIG